MACRGILSSLQFSSRRTSGKPTIFTHCTAHAVATLLYTPKSVPSMENISHQYLFHIHVKVSEETLTESIASDTQIVEAKVSIKKKTVF